MQNQNENNFVLDNKVDHDVDLRELFSVLWKGKWIIMLFTIVFAAASVAYALSKPNIYTASVLLAPAAEESSAMNGLASQFGGLASLAGVSLGSGSTDKTGLAMAVLKSRQFLTSFVNRHDLKIPLFAGKEWDIHTGKLILDNTVYDTKQKKWTREVKPGRLSEPSDWEVYKLFQELVLLDTDKKTGMITLSVEFLSPMLAKQWVDWLVLDLNKEMREKDSREVDRNINYLKANLEETNLADMRTVFYQLIEDQLKTKMLSQVREEYTFKTIDPAVIPEDKSKPKRALICVLGTLLGGVFSILLVLVKYFMRKSEE